ncbi:MAG: hypothetical protein JW737_01430 [Acidobacteria bacterium]|nr:hypothetical protein [Acidobacteriota bacterium]
MKELRLIFGIQLARIKNIVYPLRKAFVIKAILLTAFVMLFEIGIYLFFDKIFRYLLSEQSFNERFVLYLIERLMGMVFLMVFTMLIFSSILSSLSVIYLSRDLPLLFSAPMNINRIFIAKYFNTAVISSYTVVFIMIPIFLAYAHSFHTGTAFLIPALIVLIVFILFSTGIGSFITIILMRFFPAKRTHQIVTVLGLLMIIMLVSAVRMMKPERLLQPSGGTDFTAVVKSITVSSAGYFPGTWASRAILGAGQKDFRMFLTGFLPLAAAALFIVLFTYHTAKKIYYRSWALSGISRRGGSTSRSPHFEIALENAFGFLPAKPRALIVKDALLFFRDTSQWSQLLILAGLVFVYLLNIKSLPLTSAMLQSGPARGLLSYLNMTFMGFIIATVVARFGYPAVSFESKSVWVVRALPLNYRKYLWTKLLMFFLPMVILVLILTYISNLMLEIEPVMAIGSLGMMTLITFALTGLGVGLGAAYPRFHYENATQIITGLGGLIFMVISLVYIAIVVILMAIPGYLYFAYITTKHVFSVWPSVVAIAGIILLSITLAVIPMEFGYRRWKNYQL